MEMNTRILQEMTITMLCKNSLPKHIQAMIINTAYYIKNKVLIRLLLEKNPYEPWKDRKLNIGYFHANNCYSYILNINDQIKQIDSKVDKSIFLGYLCQNGWP